jgi:hypothetical protein
MLSGLLEADEEGRGRIDAAQKAADAQLEEARLAHAEAERARAAAERGELEAELRQIAADTEKQLVERRTRREAWLRERTAAASGRLDEAAREWIHIVFGDGS